MNLLEYRDLNLSGLRKPYQKVAEALARGDFRAAEVKKLAESDYYRAKLDDANRRELASLLANLNRFSAQLPALGEQSTATLASARQLADELRQLSQGLRAVLAQAGPAVGQASARLNQDTLPRLDQLASQQNLAPIEHPLGIGLRKCRDTTMPY